MKYRGSQFEYKEERDADLLRVYREKLAISDRISMPEIAQMIVESPSRRFWVSEERADIVISDLLNGKSIDHMNPMKREMFLEIFRRYKEHKAEHPSLAKKDIIWHVCNEEAPKFYLTVKSAIVLLHKARKEEKRRCYEARKQRLRFMLGTL